MCNMRLVPSKIMIAKCLGPLGGGGERGGRRAFAVNSFVVNFSLVQRHQQTFLNLTFVDMLLGWCFVLIEVKDYQFHRNFLNMGEFVPLFGVQWLTWQVAPAKNPEYCCIITCSWLVLL